MCPKALLPLRLLACPTMPGLGKLRKRSRNAHIRSSGGYGVGCRSQVWQSLSHTGLRAGGLSGIAAGLSKSLCSSVQQAQARASYYRHLHVCVGVYAEVHTYRAVKGNLEALFPSVWVPRAKHRLSVRCRHSPLLGHLSSPFSS